MSVAQPSGATLAAPPPAVRSGWARLGWVAVLLAIAALVLVPLGRLVELVATAGWGPVRRALAGTGSGAAVLNTLWTSAATTAIALPVGTAFALAVERSPVPGRGWLRAGILLPLIVPRFVLGFSWVRAYGRAGLLQDATGLRMPGLIGPVGLVVVMAVTLVPLVYLVVAAGMAARIEPDLDRAARISGATGPTGFRTVALPLLRAPLAAAATLAFAAAVESFAVPSVLAVPAGFATMTTRLYQNLTFSAQPDAFTAALVLALIMVVVVAVAVAPVDRTLATRVAPRTGGPQGSVGSVSPGTRGVVAALALWLYLVATVGVPLVALTLTAVTRAVGLPSVPANWTLANFGPALAGPAVGAILRSLALATASGLTLVALGGLVAGLERRPGRRPAGTLVTLTFALPGSALAVGLLTAYGRWLGGTLAIIFLAYLAKLWALAHRPLAGALDRLPADAPRAARASGAGPLTAWRTVVAPPVAPAALGAFALVFLFAFHELTMSSLLYGPGSRTLGVVVLDLQQLGDVTATAALALLMVAITAAAAGTLVVAARWARR